MKNVWGDTPRVVKCSRKRVLSLPCMALCRRVPFNIVYVIAGFAADDPDAVQLAGELTPFVLHVAARTVATLHSLFLAIIPTSWRCARRVADVVCGKRPGSARLCSHFAHRTLKSRVPFIHFFDGFRTSHESIKLSRWPMTLFLISCRRPN